MGELWEDSKGLVFRNKNVGTDEFFTIQELEGKTFDELEAELWQRLRAKHSKGGFRKSLENETHGSERQTMRFEWERPSDGKRQPITGARLVVEFMHESGARIVFYWADTIGG
jgi:hypothetical protein